MTLPIFLAALGLYLLTTRGLVIGDNHVHLDVALGIAERGAVALSFNPGKFFSLRDERGRIQSALWPGMAWAAVPLVATASALQASLVQPPPEPLGAALQAIDDDDPDFQKAPAFEPDSLRDQARIARLRALGQDEQIKRLNADWRVRAFALIDPLASAATLAVVFLACLALGLGERIGLWTTAALGMGSPVFGFAGTCWTQPLAMLFVAAANLQLIRALADLSWGRTIACGAFLAAAILVRPDMAVIVPVVVGALEWFAWRRGRLKQAAVTAGLLGLPLLIAGAGLLLWNWLRFSDPWVMPGGNQLMFFMAQRFPGGLLGQIFSPGAGLLWFFPFLGLTVVGLKHVQGRPAMFGWLALLQAAAVVLLFSSWWQWDSPMSPGPRYSLPIVPLLAIAAAYGLVRAGRARWAVAKCLVGLGLLVQLPGALLVAQKLPDASDPSVWLSFRCFTGWWSLWTSAAAREPIAGFGPGIDCLSTRLWFFLAAGVCILMASVVLAFRAEKAKRAT